MLDCTTLEEVFSKSLYQPFSLLSPQIISGQITISTLDLTSDLNGDSPQFTPTCISTGGPATTVTWTRDSTTTVTEGTETVLDNPETAQYTHTLNVTAAGEYTCTVANIAFSDSADITLKSTIYLSSIYLTSHFTAVYSSVPSPPTGVTAVQHGLTSIIVTWTASSDVTGYRISYTSSGGDSGSADVSGDSHTLTGLVRETTYTISITATSQSLSSSPVTVEVTLSEADPSIKN